MPIYEYECQEENCGHRFEKIQAMGEEPVTTCPKCEGVVRKLISMPRPKSWKPSEEIKMQPAGKHQIPVHQTKDGHWEQGGIIDKR